MRIVLFEDPAQLARGAAEELRSILITGDNVTVGLAGGLTPRPTYQLLRRLEVPWEQVHGWMTDERWVSADDPNSNARMAREALFSHVPAYLHTPNCGPGRDAHETAAEFEEELSSFLTDPDVVVLGVGADGHTASLFPGTEALEIEDRDYVANWVPRFEEWRVTATIPLLQRARRLIFLVAGEGKAGTMAGILEGGADSPARVVAEGSPDVTWMLDKEAASALTAAAP